MATKFRFLPLLILLIGAALRFGALVGDVRFHPDEALFATFARQAAVNGDWLLHGALDKTPLAIYSQAVSMMFVGVRSLPNGVLTLGIHDGEFAARVPGVLASIVLMAVMCATARDLYVSRNSRGIIPLVAISLTATSPYALAFSAIAFTDGLMMLLITLALWMAARGHWIWAGIWIGLGFASKQQALFYIPLIMAIGWLKHGTKITSLIRLLLPILLTGVILLLWDAARGGVTSVWALAAANNNPVGMARIDQIIPRLQTWLSYIGIMTGSGWFSAVLLLTGLTVFSARVLKKHSASSTQVDMLLLSFCATYFALHWLIAFPVHDRYPLLILPPLLLLITRGLAWMWTAISDSIRSSWGQRATTLCAVLFFSVLGIYLFLPAQNAAQGNIKIGRNVQEHRGIDRLGMYLNDKPLGTIIYDHWLGWELGYYLGTWSDKRLTYYPQPVLLALDAAIQPDPAPRYFVAPRDAPVRPWIEALRSAGFQVTNDFQTEGQIVYKLVRNPESTGSRLSGRGW